MAYGNPIDNAAYDQGYDAYWRKASRWDNPHPEDTVQYRSWEAGWNRAEMDATDF